MTSATPIADFSTVIANFDPVLGIEVHVELSTQTKMFCPCQVSFGSEANTHVCPVCIGLPGALPKVNNEAVRRAICIGLALNCSITAYSEFARKNYFYPDQPKNYQISQSDKPIAYNGYLDIPLDDGTIWRVEIERAHMEEDTGKSIHIGSSSGRIHGASHSLLDYNRAGVPLIEIVTKPIIGTGERAPEIARAYVTALRDVLAGLKVSDVRMDQGSLRCDANVSLMPKGSSIFGTRTETKNMNSLKSIETAVRYELCRQAEVLFSGAAIIQETRHYNEDDGSTSAGRPKETADDYRYFPDPDLTPIAPSKELIAELQLTIPELPWVIRDNLQKQWGISDEVMRDLVNLGALDLIIATIDEGATANAARSWWGSYLAAQANIRSVSLSQLPISPQYVARIITLVTEGTLTVKLAQQVVDRILAGEGSPDEIVAIHGLEVVRDDGALEKIIIEVLADNADIVEKIRSGKFQAVGKLVGDVMKATRGQADAAIVKDLIMKKCGVEKS